MKTLQDYIDKLNSLNFKEMYENDFFLTWEKTDEELEAVWTVADALRFMRENNISTKVFESGLGISLFRDNSTRTRFSFASACNLLGLEVQDLDEGKSQVAHGETVRETANMISFMADVIGIRDDMYIGKGNAYMHEVVDSVTQIEAHCRHFYIRANRCSSFYDSMFALTGWKTVEINGIEFELNSISSIFIAS